MEKEIDAVLNLLASSPNYGATRREIINHLNESGFSQEERNHESDFNMVFLILFELDYVHNLGFQDDSDEIGESIDDYEDAVPIDPNDPAYLESQYLYDFYRISPKGLLLFLNGGFTREIEDRRSMESLKVAVNKSVIQTNDRLMYLGILQIMLALMTVMITIATIKLSKWNNIIQQGILEQQERHFRIQQGLSPIPFPLQLDQGYNAAHQKVPKPDTLTSTSDARRN